MGQAFILQDIWDTWLLPTIWQQTPHHSYKQKCPTGVAPVLVSPIGTHLASHYWLLRNEHLQEKEMATHSSILAWKNPWMEESGGLKSMGLHDWACVHEGGGRWVGSSKLEELKKKKKETSIFNSIYYNICLFSKVISNYSKFSEVFRPIYIHRMWNLPFLHKYAIFTSKIALFISYSFVNFNS